MASQPVEDAAIAGKSKSGITGVLVYPNPAPTQFRLQLSGEPKAGSTVALLLKNANGETVWSNAKAPVSSLGGLAVNVSKLPNGIYFLQVTDEDKNVITKKVIISR